MVSSVPPTVAATMKRLRGDVTQPELVRRVVELGGKLSTGHIGEVEAGNRNLSPDKIEWIALALELTEAQHNELLAAAGHSKAGAAAHEIVRRQDEFDARLARLEAAVEKL